MADTTALRDHRHEAQRWFDRSSERSDYRGWEATCLAKAQYHATMAVADRLDQLLERLGGRL